MHAPKGLARTCSNIFLALFLAVAFKSDTGRYKRAPLYERALQQTEAQDAPKPPEEAKVVPADAQDNGPKDPPRIIRDYASEEQAAQLAYRRISLEVGMLAAKDLFEDAVEGDDPKSLDDWLMAMLTKACGKDEKRCSIPLAASVAQELIQKRAKELLEDQQAKKAYVLVEAVARHADPETTSKPMRGIDVAIKARDPQLASRYIKERTEGKEDEHTKVLSLVESLEGKHLDMPDLLPRIDKQNPDQGVLIRKSLRHQYRTIREWRLPVAQAECASGVPDKCDEVEELQRTLAELESVNTVIGFL